MNNSVLSDSHFDDYLIKLKSEAVDACDGTILSPGQVVIRSPFNESLVSADSSDHRRLFAELGFVWDEPTRIRRVKAEVDKYSKLRSFGNIRSVDIANELKMSVSQVESVFLALVQTSDYYFDENEAVDSTGKECLTIVKRK